MAFQANTAEKIGAPLNNQTGNSFLDALNVLGGFVERGAGIYGEITAAKTQREIDLFNARNNAQPLGSSQPPLQSPVISIEGVEKLAFTVGIGILAFVGVTAYMSSKGK